MRISRFFVSLMIGMWFVPSIAHANLQQQMDQMFGSMVNVTNPTAYQGQRMGAFSGGSLYVRNKIVNTNIIGFVPPHISAGCGGIDMFGGSFSFINASQFQNLLRSIASNAGGYFFQLALQAMCPTCMEEMSKLQKAVQSLNQLAGNSCMLGKALVDSAATSIIPGDVDQDSILGQMRKNAAADAASSTAAFQDSFDSLFPSDGKNTESKVANADPTFLKNKQYIGNIAWQLIQNSNVGSWFSFGDQDMKETIISMTGTIVIHDATSSITSPGGTTDKSVSSDTYPPILTPEELVSGTKDGTVKIYRCDTVTDCMKPAQTNVTGFVDFTKRVTDILNGNGVSPGIVFKFAHPSSGATLTASEQSFIETAPAPIAAMIRNLAQKGESTAKQFVETLAPWIAREMAYRFTADLIFAMRTAAEQAKPEQKAQVSAFKKMLIERVSDKLFAMKRANQETDKTLLYAMQAYQNLRIQIIGKRRIAEHLMPDSNNAANH